MSDLGGTGVGGSWYQVFNNMNIALGNILKAMVNFQVAGGVFPTQAQGKNGLFPTPIGVTNFRNADGSALAAAASVGKFGYSITLATRAVLIGEVALGNTKTDDAIAEVVLPPWFLAAAGIIATVNAGLSGTGVAGTHTIQVKAYRTGANGLQGPNIGPGVASLITAAGADVTFAIAGGTLNPGDRLMIEVETVVQETGGALSLAALVNSIRLS